MEVNPKGNLKSRAQQLRDQINDLIERKNLDNLNIELDEVRAQMTQPGFWEDNERAREITKREASLSQQVGPWLELQAKAKELADIVELDDASLNEELSQQLDDLEASLTELSQSQQFEGPYDDHDAILSIHVGAGGTDAQDWVEMLGRMYLRWAEQHNLQTQSLDQSPGEEAGLKSLTVAVRGGDHVYGRLAGEHGVHRLVRISPFNAARKRQTSFARVEVLPEIASPAEVELEDKDLRIDVFRSSGAGGQSVNTTDSAVRVTHLPTGIAVAIQNERSQLQNRQTALAVIRSKLVALQLEQHAKSLADIKGPTKSAEWGNQIRSYVLQPYRQVKDSRTGYETSDVQAVLDGDLDPLIQAWLTKK